MSAPAVPALRDLVLIGGGHSHIQVIRSLGMRTLAGVRVTLINQAYDTPYSGMLPGFVAGAYRAEDLHIQLNALCNFAGARFVRAEVVGLDLDAHVVRFAGRPDLRFDVLSINTGAVPVAPAPGAITVKPISQFVPKWQAFVERATQAVQEPDRDELGLVIVGAGAGGFELAVAARGVLPAALPVTVVGPQLLPGHGRGARRIAAAHLEQIGVRFVAARVLREDAGGAVLDSGETLPASDVFWVTGVQAPAWLQDSGLAVDDAGFVEVNPYLQSTSHPHVFAAGDVAHLLTQPRAKSGVYAVRAGPTLSLNLRRAVTRGTLQRYRAQRKHLALIGLANGRALASRGRWASEGRLWWRLKQWIDRRFVARFNDLPVMEPPVPAVDESLRSALPQQTMRCGGCGAKLAAEPLRRVLDQLPTQASANVHLGIGDDAAVVSNGGATTLLTVDGFRAMVDDPYLFGRIVAHHSMNDIFAMGAQPRAALAFVTLPLMAEQMMEQELLQVLRGIVDVLNASGASLVGGHSAEGAELGVGLTVTGEPAGELLGKGGMAAGQHLILTKPLGTGVLLAGAMQGQVPAEALAATMAGMDQSNAIGADVLRQHGATALTDVTGFGLAGHLGEMLRASQVGARLSLAQIGMLPGAAAQLERVESSLQRSNELALQDFVLCDGLRQDDPRVRLLADPQTSGGLLASVPAHASADCVAALVAAGYTASCIGEVGENWENWEIGA